MTCMPARSDKKTFFVTDHIVIAYVVLAHIVMAHTVVAYIVMADIVIAHIAMALIDRWCVRWRGRARSVLVRYL